MNLSSQNSITPINTSKYPKFGLDTDGVRIITLEARIQEYITRDLKELSYLRSKVISLDSLTLGLKDKVLSLEGLNTESNKQKAANWELYKKVKAKEEKHIEDKELLQLKVKGLEEDRDNFSRGKRLWKFAFISSGVIFTASIAGVVIWAVTK